jgi:uncharacterized protein with HEPN domain
VSRRDADRLDDLVAAEAAIRAHLDRGGLDDPLVLDAVRMRMVEIGEAVKGISPELLATESNVDWSDVAGTRNWIAHHYFDTDPDILMATIDNDLAPLMEAVHRLRERVADTKGDPAASG